MKQRKVKTYQSFEDVFGSNQLFDHSVSKKEPAAKLGPNDRKIKCHCLISLYTKKLNGLKTITKYT